MYDKEALKNLLSQIKLVMLDLDGTTYIENELIPGALDVLNQFNARGIHYLFLTNNSSKSSKEYVTKISQMGIPVSEDNVFTSGQATSLFLEKTKPGAKIFLVGTSSLHNEMSTYNIRLVNSIEDNPDFVVVGFDMELDYKKLLVACELIDKGVPFYATHPDMVCPIKDKRYIPDCGAICQMITHATGKTAEHFGKPDKKMVEIIADKFSLNHSELLMIGDRLYTDIALGKNAGIATICVLSGESSKEDIASSEHKPDFVINSIKDLLTCL